MEVQPFFYNVFIEEEINKKNVGSKYTIKMTANDKNSSSWFIEKNLKELHDFRLELCRTFPNIPFNLPFIKLLGSPTQSEKDNDRAQVLGFLQEIVSRTDVMTSEIAGDFFALDQVFKQQNPDQKVIFSKLEWPIINFYYCQATNYFIYVQTDLDQASQVAKEASNQKWPCCKQQENTLRKPVSKIQVASISCQSSSSYDFLPEQDQFEICFTAEFSKKVTAFAWDFEQRRLVLGFSNGRVVTYDIKEQELRDKKHAESEWYRIESKFEYEQKHVFLCGSSDIVGIEIDMNNCIIASKKHGFFVYDLSGEAAQSIVTDYKIDEENLTCMEYNQTEKYAYIASNSGVVNVIQLTQSQPNPISTFSVQIESSIKTMHLDKQNGFLLAATHDKCVHILEDIQTNKSPFKIIQYQGKAKGSSIAINKTNKDVYVSDTTGNITVWGFNPNVPKYAWTAHKKSILKMQFYPGANVIVTSSKDKTLKLFVLKQDWIPEPWTDFFRIQYQKKEPLTNEQ